MNETILVKLAERGAEAVLLGIILLILAPMGFRLVDKMIRAMRDESRLERDEARKERIAEAAASRLEAAAFRGLFHHEMETERSAHREETVSLADAMRGLELATREQTAAVTREIKQQTEQLERALGREEEDE